MKQGLFTIIKNVPLTPQVYLMVLEGDTSAITNSGQFVNIQLNGSFLRRPISVCDYDDTTLTLIYKIVGEGTAKMATLTPNHKLDLLSGLGNGYDLSKSGDAPVLIGGGVGIPPLYHLCKSLLAQGKHPSVILGFNTKDEIFAKDLFEALGVPVIIATADGSYGIKGFVTDALKTIDNYTYFYTCGPEGMFKALEAVVTTSGQFSFEERMGCGFGACMGCSCETKYGNKRICKDGPVLEREEIIW